MRIKAKTSFFLSIIIYLYIFIIFIVLTSPIISSESIKELTNGIIKYLTQVKDPIELLAGLGFIVALLITLHKLSQQEKQMVLQQKSLEEVIINNKFQQSKGHVEHFRSNVNYIREGHFDNIEIGFNPAIAYHKVYQLSSVGSLNTQLQAELDEKVSFFIDLMTDYKYESEYRNEALNRFVDISASVNAILGSVGLTCTLRVQSEPDDGKVYLGTLYEYIVTSFSALLFLLDGNIGKYSSLITSISEIDYDSYESSYIEYDEEYHHSFLDEAVSFLKNR